MISTNENLLLWEQRINKRNKSGGKSLNFNSKIKINFEGGDLTSDAGFLLYKEFDEKIGFSKTIKENLYVEDV